MTVTDPLAQCRVKAGSYPEKEHPYANIKLINFKIMTN